jgi:hypothetical protein
MEEVQGKQGTRNFPLYSGNFTTYKVQISLWIVDQNIEDLSEFC